MWCDSGVNPNQKEPLPEHTYRQIILKMVWAAANEQRLTIQLQPAQTETYCRAAVLTSSRRVFILMKPHIFFKVQLVLTISVAASGVSPRLFLHMSMSIWSRKGWIGGNGLPSIKVIRVRMGTSNELFDAHPTTFSEVSFTFRGSPSLSRSLISSTESHSWQRPSKSSSSSDRLTLFLLVCLAAIGQSLRQACTANAAVLNAANVASSTSTPVLLHMVCAYLYRYKYI